MATSNVCEDTESVAPQVPTEPEYLGDGVYATFDGYHVILAVPGFAHETRRNQRIALEPAVYFALRRYAKQFLGEKA